MLKEIITRVKSNALLFLLGDGDGVLGYRMVSYNSHVVSMYMYV